MTNNETFLDNDSCLQKRLNNYCYELAEDDQCAGNYHARFNRQKSKWRCYSELNADGEEAKECIDEFGERTMCIRHADGADYCQIHQAALPLIEEGCIGND